MKFDLTQDQEEFLSTTRKFLSEHAPSSALRDLWPSEQGFEPKYWKLAADLGWTAAFVPETLGGGCVSGQPVEDAALVAETIGAQAAPGPFLPCNVVAAGVAFAGASEQHALLLRALADGSAIASWAIEEPGGRWSSGSPEITTTVEQAGDELAVRGKKAYVEAAGVADYFLVTARSDAGPTQVLVPAGQAGVSVVKGRSLDVTRRFGSVDFDTRLPASSLVGPWGGASEAIDHQLAVAIALQCAESVGAADHVLTYTMEYMQGRYAFGRPIASFQALKHRIADMEVWVEFSKAITDSLIHALDHAGGGDVQVLTSVAKAYVGEHCLDIIDDCVQLNGGIGMTWEHDIHIYSRRAALNRALYGSPEQHRERICMLLDL